MRTTETTTPITSPATATTAAREARSRLAALLLVGLLTGCGAVAEPTTPTDLGPPQGPAAASPDEVVADPAPVPALVARTRGELDVHERPGSDVVVHTLEATTGFGSPTVLSVVEVDGGWAEVRLPVRPNGSTGWIRLAEVEVSEVDVAVEVDLDERELTVIERGEVVLTAEVAIGDRDHPTPTGTFSITDKLDTGDPDGPYGPFALGLSARSDVLTDFAGGDGQVGIHGTDTPATLGQPVSHGCIRVDNDTAVRLARLLPLGTPVVVL
jgi:hypothetical protein